MFRTEFNKFCADLNYWFKINAIPETERLRLIKIIDSAVLLTMDSITMLHTQIYAKN